MGNIAAIRMRAANFILSANVAAHLPPPGRQVERNEDGGTLALVAMLVPIAILIARIHFEERFLAANVQGYGDYTEHVRYRLIPGLW